MPTPSFDTIIIGAGLNGLACAGRLAQGGAKVLVLEAADQPGGGALTAEFAPGYRVDRLAHLVTHLDGRMLSALKPEAHGLNWAVKSMPTTVLSAEGRHLTLTGAYGASAPGLDPREARRWADLRARLLRHAEVLRPLREITPPLPGKGGAKGNVVALGKAGLALRRLGREEMQEFLRMILINVHDVTEESLTDDRLRGLLAFDATLGAFLGPRSPNSLFLLWHRLSGDAGHIRWPSGGMGALAAAVTRAVEATGAEIRCKARVERLLTDGDRITGVRLEGGEEITVSRVISTINPRTTLLDLLGAREIDTGLVRRVSNIRMRGTTAKLHLALREAPEFLGADLRHRLVIAPSSEAVELAFNAVKYGEFSAEPVMEIMSPSAHEAGFAPEGHHVLSIVAQYVPFVRRGGWDAGARDGLKAAIMARLEAHAPGIGALVTASELLATPDIADRHGLVGGSWHQGDLAVEQMLFMRPAIGIARYATPVPGLWLAGAGSHPGGGISGAAGWNAANEILGAA
ncbi:MAG: NAD(P)/FAD-dependent oxidoreductase [Rubellimicrobium sp.]|nr:NAD(P)/FAD-dependent oxidoreductase [Rubellimicrobium sp.]